MNIAVLLGGISPERNVSIAGGKAVINALKEKGHNVVAIDPAFGANGLIKEEDLVISNEHPSLEELSKFQTKSMIECINSSLFDNIDVAFLVLHGKNCEDGMIQALLELRGIPYTGSGVMASSVGMDKITSKLLFTAAGISTPPWTVVRPEEVGNYEHYKDIRDDLGDHLIIKPNDQGSSIGCTIVENGNLDEIHEGIQLAFKYSKRVLIEQFIEGREITVGIVGNQVLPVIEIVPEDGFYDYKHKYTKGHTEYICPADLSEDIAEFTQNLAMASFNVTSCSGFARADFRLTDDGLPLIMEINTIPGFTATSLVPMAAKEMGIEFADLCEEIINIALENHK